MRCYSFKYYILYLLLFLFVVSIPIYSQGEHKSIHEIEYNNHVGKTVHDRKEIIFENNLMKGERLPIKVFGWHPYWAASNDHLAYDYNVLSTIGYFSYNVDPATGTYISIHNWDKTPIIDYAHQLGVKVVLVITNFGYDENDMLLSDPQKTSRLIDESVRLVKKHGGDGINIDFESIRSSQRENLSIFMTELAKELKSEIPEAELSICLPAVYWTDAFDLQVLAAVCDYMLIMGYGYFWAGSVTAGPVAPLVNRTYCVKNSIITNLEAGVPKETLFLGVPWYGIDWQVENHERMAKSTASGKARIFPAMEWLADIHGKIFDDEFKTPWIAYYDGGWRQAWYDDSLSLSYKYQMIESFGLGGIGIWAISYQDDAGVVWRGLRDYFTPTAVNDEVSNDIIIYPNPCRETLNIILPECFLGANEICIMSFEGKVIYENIISNIKELRIDLSELNLSAGLYLCIIKAEKKVFRKHIVIC